MGKRRAGFFARAPKRGSRRDRSGIDGAQVHKTLEPGIKRRYTGTVHLWLEYVLCSCDPLGSLSSPSSCTPFDIVTIDTTLPQLLCRIKYFGLASLRDVCFECLVSHLGGLTTCHVGANNEEFSKFSFDQAAEDQDFVLQIYLDCFPQIIALRVQDPF